MSKILWKSLLASPAILGVTLAYTASAIASEVDANTVAPSVSSLEQINQYGNEGSDNLAQVTSVSQLSDVQPTDWAFQALQSLVERYGCIAGYPDGTYRGNRPMTRYEFAAGMNACLDQILEIVGGGGGISPEDLETIRRLQEEFAAELATLRGRVDALEARTAELEANQFSTTTKLNGEAIFSVYGGAQDDDFTGLVVDGFAIDDVVVEGEDFNDQDQIAAGYRVRLNFDTSFTGRDLLRTRLQARDQQSLASDPFGFSWGGGSGDDAADDITLDDFFYSFPVGERAEVIVGLNSLAVDDFVASTISPLDSSGGGGLNDFSGPVVYDLFDNGDVGAGAIIQLTDSISLDLGYTAGEGKDPDDGAGLFNGDYSAIGQLTFLSDFIDAALTYVHSFSGDSRLALSDVGTVGNTYGGQVNFKFDGFEVGGGVSYTDVIELELDSTELWSWNATLAFPDLGGEGNLLGIYGGLVPTYGRALVEVLGDNDFDSTSYLIEGFYKYQLTDNISLTPGVIWIINPGSNSDNDDTIIGALRTTFRF